MKSAYERNIVLMNIYSVLIKRVSMPIIILYFLFNSLSFTEIGILASVMVTVALVLEIPGGIYADLRGRKASLLICSFFSLLTMLLYFLGDSFAYFLIASVAYGIAGAFISGTRESLLYDTLKKIKKASQFKKYNGRNLFYSHFFNALILLAIPVVYSYSHKLPFLIGIVFFAASFITALFLTEPRNTASKKAEHSIKNYKIKFSTSFRDILSNRLLLALLLFGSVTAAFIYSASEFIQPLLKISGLQIIYFGIIYALMRAVMGLAGIFTHRFEKYMNLGSLLIFGAALVLISLAGLSYGAGLVIIISILILKFSEGFTRVLLDDEMNRRIKSANGNRTTVLSISNLSDSLFNALLVLLFGILADKNGVQGMFVFACALFFILALASLLYVKSSQSSAVKKQKHF